MSCVQKNSITIVKQIIVQSTYSLLFERIMAEQLTAYFENILSPVTSPIEKFTVSTMWSFISHSIGVRPWMRTNILAWLIWIYPRHLTETNVLHLFKLHPCGLSKACSCYKIIQINRTRIGHGFLLFNISINNLYILFEILHNSLINNADDNHRFLYFLIYLYSHGYNPIGIVDCVV